jgi:hypothetical protein
MILKFINRKKELEGLDTLYGKEGSGLFIVYGRRRVGKTELVKKFIERKPNFYFLAKKQSIELEIERFKEMFSKEFDVYLEKSNNIEKLFRQIIEKIDPKEKFVFVIDEFPYWIEEYKNITSDFQHLWDEFLKNKNILIILTGSSIGMMETEVLGYKSPLYGRRTGQLKLEEIPFEYLKDFLPNYEIEYLIRTYGAIGGIPFYLKEFDPEKNFWENIKSTFFNKLNILYEEANILLREELRKPNIYFNIIKAIIDGSTTLSEISSKSKVDITNLNKYIKVLKTLDIIEREYPITKTAKKKNFLYAVKDNYFKFWLTYVYPNMEQIEENPEQLLESVKRDYSGYMGPIFEKICEKFLRKKFKYDKLGRWWYKDKEIDIVALDKKRILFGECKWSKNPIGIKTLIDLEEKAKNVREKGKKEERYILFSKSGFKKNLKELDRKDLILVDLEKMKNTLSLN